MLSTQQELPVLEFSLWKTGSPSSYFNTSRTNAQVSDMYATGHRTCHNDAPHAGSRNTFLPWAICRQVGLSNCPTAGCFNLCPECFLCSLAVLTTCIQESNRYNRDQNIHDNTYCLTSIGPSSGQTNIMDLGKQA